MLLRATYLNLVELVGQLLLAGLNHVATGLQAVTHLDLVELVGHVILTDSSIVL